MPGAASSPLSDSSLSFQKSLPMLHEHARRAATLAPRYLEEGQAGQQVSHVAPQGLQRRVGLGHPHGWHFAHEHAIEDVLQLRGHHDLPFNGSAETDETSANHSGQPVGMNEAAQGGCLGAARDPTRTPGLPLLFRP